MKSFGLRLKNNLLILFVGLFSVFYLFTSTVIYGNPVLIQTLYNLLIISILLLVLNGWKVKNNSQRIIKIVLLGFWIGQGSMYLINFDTEKQLIEWLLTFNRYMLFVPVYVGSLLISIIYTYVSEKRILR